MVIRFLFVLSPSCTHKLVEYTKSIYFEQKLKKSVNLKLFDKLNLIIFKVLSFDTFAQNLYTYLPWTFIRNNNAEYIVTFWWNHKCTNFQLDNFFFHWRRFQRYGCKPGMQIFKWRVLIVNLIFYNKSFLLNRMTQSLIWHKQTNRQV